MTFFITLTALKTYEHLLRPRPSNSALPYHLTWVFCPGTSAHESVQRSHDSHTASLASWTCIFPRRFFFFFRLRSPCIFTSNVFQPLISVSSFSFLPSFVYPISLPAAARPPNPRPNFGSDGVETDTRLSVFMKMFIPESFAHKRFSSRESLPPSPLVPALLYSFSSPFYISILLRLHLSLFRSTAYFAFLYRLLPAWQLAWVVMFAKGGWGM
jgi:hypothetical protein